MTSPISPFLLSQHYKQHAIAMISGGEKHPDIYGMAIFYENPFTKGLMIEVEVSHLPATPWNCPHFLGMHIHETGDCSENFTKTGMHYNPSGQAHPCHAGDLPPLLNNNGYAYLCFYDKYLSLEDITGRSLVIHEKRDDFTSQPSGDSGEKIACGVIKGYGDWR